MRGGEGGGERKQNPQSQWLGLPCPNTKEIWPAATTGNKPTCIYVSGEEDKDERTTSSWCFSSLRKQGEPLSRHDVICIASFTDSHLVG